jgi:hypothetical protein
MLDHRARALRHGAQRIAAVQQRIDVPHRVRRAGRELGIDGLERIAESRRRLPSSEGVQGAEAQSRESRVARMPTHERVDRVEGDRGTLEREQSFERDDRQVRRVGTRGEHLRPGLRGIATADESVQRLCPEGQRDHARRVARQHLSGEPQHRVGGRPRLDERARETDPRHQPRGRESERCGRGPDGRRAIAESRRVLALAHLAELPTHLEERTREGIPGRLGRGGAQRPQRLPLSRIAHEHDPRLHVDPPRAGHGPPDEQFVRPREARDGAQVHLRRVARLADAEGTQHPLQGIGGDECDGAPVHVTTQPRSRRIGDTAPEARIPTARRGRDRERLAHERLRPERRNGTRPGQHARDGPHLIG